MILIVDDNNAIREMLVAVLEAANYSVRAAANGAEALALIEHECPSLILMDITMPGLTGYQVLQQLREKHGEHLPVVLVSALPEDEERGNALGKGATDYISKPFDIPSILHCVRRYMPDAPAA